MSAAEYRQLENCLEAAEEAASNRVLLHAEAREIRDEVRALLAKVTKERIRAEEREKIAKARSR